MVRPAFSRATRRAIFGFLFVLIAGCGRAPRVDPPVYTYDTVAVQEASARIAAKAAVGGVLYSVAPTGSMSPLLQGGDVVVVDKSVPISDSLGRPVAYWPEWNLEYLGMKVPVIHRAVASDKYGLLMEGDSVPHGHSENKYRVTNSNYIGVVTGIYRVKK